MKKVHVIHIVATVMFASFIYGVVSLKHESPNNTTKQTPRAQHARILTAGATTIINFNVLAKDATNFPVELTLVGYQRHHPDVDNFILETAHQYASTRTSAEILLEYPDGIIRLTFFVPTMPLLTVGL